MIKTCIAGVDGAGKSTQATLLERYLHIVKGYRAHRLWLRWFSLTTYLLYLYARLTRRTVIVRTRARPVHIHAFWVDKILSTLYPRFLLADLLLWFLVNKLIAQMRGVDLLLLDRCFLDSIIDLIWEVRNISFLYTLISKALLGATHTFKTVILVVDPRTAIKRKQDIVSLKEISFKEKCYKIFAKHMSIPVIDTTGKTPRETLEEIKRLLKLM